MNGVLGEKSLKKVTYIEHNMIRNTFDITE